MPVQTQIQVRRSTAATWTSTNPTLAAGEIGFETDTGKFKIGTGSSTWTALSYNLNGGTPSGTDIPLSTVTTKGDLVAGTGSSTVSRLAAGNNGEMLVADSSTSTGLRYQAPKVQNAIYNSGFDIAQRGTSFTALAAVDYTLDRWVNWSTTGGQSNYASQQSVGNLSVSPNQAIRYCGRFGRTAATTNTGARNIFQTLETADSVKFAGQTVTMSFYARAGANYSPTSNALGAAIVSGTGTDQIYYSFTGALTVANTTATLTTSWQRFSITGTVATNVTEIGTVFTFTPTGTAGAADYFEITGVQLEVGSVATPFNRQNGTIQGELAACQRYYWRDTSGNSASYHAIAIGNGTTIGFCLVNNPVQMRLATPSSIDYANLELTLPGSTNYSITGLTIESARCTPLVTSIKATGAVGLVNGMPYYLVNSSTAGYLGFSAEL